MELVAETFHQSLRRTFATDATDQTQTKPETIRMKLNLILCITTTAVFGLSGLASPAILAAEHEKPEHGTRVVVPETVDGIMTAIHTKHGQLGDVVKAKKLADVHHHAFEIRDLANALPAKVAADKKPRVEGAVKNIAKLAEDLDKSGDNNDQPGTEANLKKLDGVLMLLDKQVK